MNRLHNTGAEQEEADPRVIAMGENEMSDLRRVWMFVVGLFCLGFCAITPSRADVARLADGSTVNYKQAGSGDRTVILIHGWSFDHRMWDKVSSQFPAGYKVIAYDLRGFGGSSKPASGYDYAGFVKDLAGLMDSLNIRKAVISGHSLGAMIAQDFAATHPDRVEALVLTAPQARTVASTMSDPIKAFIQRMEGLPNQNATGPEWRAFFTANSPRYFMAQNLGANDIDQFLAQNTLASPSALVEAFKLVFEAPALPGNHPGTKVPTLVVYGTHDIVPFPVIRQIATDHGDSCVAVIERAGHTPPWEKPEAWTQVTVSFLSRLQEPAARRCR